MELTEPDKPKPRRKKGNRPPLLVVTEAALVGEKHFNHFITTGKLWRCPAILDPKV